VTEQVDCAVIGAGVVGLAIARELAMAGREVIVLEAADAIGTHTSSRNSEVIHAGLYYPKGSLKARFCVTGKTLLYDYCTGHGVPHSNIGKIVVAVTDDETATLKNYVQKAGDNGVGDLRWLSREELRKLEPEVECVAGFLSPSTGIIDSHALMLAYQGDAENHGAALVFKSPVESGAIGPEGIVLNVGGNEPMTIACKSVVNSAGLFAQDIARSAAMEWITATDANIKFEFVTDVAIANIRVTFAEHGRWSYVGIDALDVPAGAPTMSLGTADHASWSVALHQFGHALGLAHEYPAVAGGLRWDMAALMRVHGGAPNWWTEEQVRHRVIGVYGLDLMNGVSVDPDSIMRPPIPMVLASNSAATSWNAGLSTRDKALIASSLFYPRGTSPAASSFPKLMGSSAPEVGSNQ